jgi:hypothetical protein
VRAKARPLSEIPAWIVALLLAGFAAQVAWQAWRVAPEAQIIDLPAAPSPLLLRAASLGEPELAARIAMLYLQAYDLSGDNAVAYQRLDYARLIAWLRTILETDPRSSYALFSAARIYAENDDRSKCRAILEFLREAFERDPDRHWLGDLPLALRYARAIDRKARDPRAPLWAKQMEIFILEDMNELEAVKIMLGGLIASGLVRDPGELRFLRQRLQTLQPRQVSTED